MPFLGCPGWKAQFLILEHLGLILICLVPFLKSHKSDAIPLLSMERCDLLNTIFSPHANKMNQEHLKKQALCLLHVQRCLFQLFYEILLRPVGLINPNEIHMWNIYKDIARLTKYLLYKGLNHVKLLFKAEVSPRKRQNKAPVTDHNPSRAF